MWNWIKSIFVGIYIFFLVLAYILVFLFCFIIYALLFKFINREKKDSKAIDV